MNRNLLVFSLLLILVGFALGVYLLGFFGLLLLIPALASPSRPPTQKAPPQPQQPRPRVIPSQNPPPPPQPAPMAEPASRSASPAAPMYSPSPSQPVVYSPALFPSPLLPSLSVMGSMSPPPKMPQEAKQEGRDELVEVGTILVLLKLVFG